MTLTDGPVVLQEHESWALAREAVVGRLAVTVDAEPDIFPVNYVVDHGSVVIRTAEGTKLAAAVNRAVAFEVDGYDPVTGNAWSVVMKGQVRELTQLHEVLDALELPLHTWHAAPKPRLLCIEPTSVTGRRFPRPAPPAWVQAAGRATVE